MTSAGIQGLDNCDSQSLDQISVVDNLMLETQPYVKYDTRGQSRYEYGIGHISNNTVDARVSVSDLQEEYISRLQYYSKQDNRYEHELDTEGLDVQYMSDIFAQKVQDTSILTEDMRKTFFKKTQVLMNMLSDERTRQSEMEKAINALNKMQSTEQEINILTQQLEQMQEIVQSAPNKETDKEL